MHFTLTFIALVFLWVHSVSAGPAEDLSQSYLKTDQYAHKNEMNGIAYKQYLEFWKKWNLVSSRYRTDTSEIRLTYANDLAWETLIKGRTDFPDGSVLGKVGYLTASDPSFESSRLPAIAKRFQLMVRDKELFKETDGWGYALFNDRGRTFAGEPKAAAFACHACHKIVSERGYVFSKPMDLVVTKLKPEASSAKALPSSQSLRFREIRKRELPELLQKLLPAAVDTLSSLEGELTKDVIAGTLDEIRPALIKEAKSKSRPALLLAHSGTAYSIVWLESSPTCSGGHKQFVTLIAFPQPNKSSESLLKLGNVCD